MKTQWWDKRLSKDGCLWGAELHFDMGSENRGWQWLFEWAAYDDLDTSEIYIERQVTSDLVHKGIEEAKINAELRAEIERLQAQWAAQPEEDAGYVCVDGYRHLAAFLHTTPPKVQNFCPRCGKRTPDLTTIHTCTPPRGLEMT